MLLKRAQDINWSAPEGMAGGPGKYVTKNVNRQGVARSNNTGCRLADRSWLPRGRGAADSLGRLAIPVLQSTGSTSASAAHLIDPAAQVLAPSHPPESPIDTRNTRGYLSK